MNKQEFQKLIRAMIVETLKESDPVKESDDDMLESDDDHEPDDRWENHPDPTGKDWHSGMDKK